MTMNLVAIAGLPIESAPRPVWRSVGATELPPEDKPDWLPALVGFGIAAVVGYYVGDKLL